jgi:hypothetical protein
MLKIAQRRGLLNQLREKVNMPGAYLEGFFKPELDRVMVALKELDDRIRSELSGKPIGSAAPQITQSAKEILKSAKQNFNRREYMSGVSDLGMFHKKMFDVSEDIKRFFVDVNKIHHKFLFEGVNDEKLKQLRQHMERKASFNDADHLVKEAGIMDFFYNIGTKRGRGLAAWEKKYPKEVKELRDGGNSLVNQAEVLLANTLARLKEMATARAVRRPDDYMDAANKIKAEFDKFDSGAKGFKNYYGSVIVPFLKIKDDVETEEAKMQPADGLATTPTDPNAGKVELGAPPPQSSAQPMPLVKLKEAPAPSTPTVSAPAVEPQTSPMSGPPTFINEPVPNTLRSSAKKLHNGFFNLLASMQNENPAILAKFIVKYAASIEQSDPEAASKLFSVAKQIGK